MVPFPEILIVMYPEGVPNEGIIISKKIMRNFTKVEIQKLIKNSQELNLFELDGSIKMGFIKNLKNESIYLVTSKSDKAEIQTLMCLSEI